MESRLAKPRDYYHTFESYRCMLARVHRLPCWKAGALPVRLENGGVGEWLNPAVLKFDWYYYPSCIFNNFRYR